MVGTNSYFFDSIKAQNRSLSFTSGQAFSDQKDHELVLGANVAKQYKHRIGDRIILSHGTGKGPAQDHANSPFVVTGILAATGTPIDNSVFISIQSFNNLHDGSKNLQFAQLDSAQYTAFLIGLQQRSAVFSVRRQIDALKSFSLMAIMPGVALDELWQTMEIAENALIQSVKDAVKYKLIDATKYRDEVIDILADKVKNKKGEEESTRSFISFLSI